MSTKSKVSAESIAKAREYFPRGSTVYLVIRSAARSGMSRSIGVVTLAIGNNGEHDIPMISAHPNGLVAEILGRRLNKDGDGIVCPAASLFGRRADAALIADTNSSLLFYVAKE